MIIFEKFRKERKLIQSTLNCSTEVARKLANVIYCYLTEPKFTKFELETIARLEGLL